MAFLLVSKPKLYNQASFQHAAKCCSTGKNLTLMNIDPSWSSTPWAMPARAFNPLSVFHQLFFAGILLFKSAPLCLMPTAKIAERWPAGRAGELLLVLPLQSIDVGLLLLFKIAPLLVVTLEHIVCHGGLLC
jgi:hypothetical protein